MRVDFNTYFPKFKKLNLTTGFEFSWKARLFLLAPPLKENPWLKPEGNWISLPFGCPPDKNCSTALPICCNWSGVSVGVAGGGRGLEIFILILK